MKLLHNISIENLFNINSEHEFNENALEIFHYQYSKNAIYQNFCKFLKRIPQKTDHYSQIPFLPIQFFKSHTVLSTDFDKAQKIFKSSGTTKTGRSKHHVAQLALYETSFSKAFFQFYGNPKDLTIIALLPSYQAQGDSSLVHMVAHLISLSDDKRSGFYLNQNKQLCKILTTLNEEKKPTLLIGVSYALLDLIDQQKELKIPNITIMETGGMKGKRKEMPKDELHNVLKAGFGAAAIHSEYGMTELLSQGYSKGDGIFEFPRWIKPLLRQTNDPLSLQQNPNKSGGVNIIDLANIYSCSFIATQDLGKISNLGMQIVGRFDHADTRGCNLLVDL